MLELFCEGFQSTASQISQKSLWRLLSKNVISDKSFTPPLCVCLCVVPCGLLQPGYLMPGQLNEGAGGHRDDPQDSNVAGVVFPNQPATQPYLHAKFCCFTNHCGLNLPHVTLAHSCTLTIPPPNTQFHVAVSPM